MDAKQRRERILELLKKSQLPISASILAKQLFVSRQVIVGDVALLRASGAQISATPHGYIYKDAQFSPFPYEGILACKHTPEQLQEELYTIVDFGGFVLDVTIDHPLYGQLSGPLNLGSRYDVDLFLKKIESEANAKPLSVLTGGIHLHKIGCRSQDTFDRIKESLVQKGIVFLSSE